MRMQHLPWLLGILAIAAAPAQEIWSATLGAPAVQAPLVADIHEAAGPETVAVLTEGRVVAFQADGQSLWNIELGAPIAPGTQSALSPKTEKASAGLAVPLAGAIQLINAATGELLWKADVPGATWLVMGDLNEDQLPDIVAAGADGSLTALDGTDGAPLWAAKTSLTAITGPPAVADIDDDRLPEIFVPGKEGLAVVDTRGDERAFVDLDHGALGGPVVGDLDDDGRFEVYLALPGGVIAAYEADNGDRLWETKTAMADSPVPGLALADLDQDEHGELVVAGARTLVLNAEGEVLFESDTTGRGPVIADANSDGEVEIIVAGDKISLLDAALAHVAAIALPSPSRFAPVAAAINGVALLTIGEDDTLRVTRTGARLMPQLAPWPQPRRDATGRAGSLSPLLELDRLADGPQLAPSNSPLAFAGGFEGPESIWTTDSGSAVLDTGEKAAGNASLKLTPAGEGVLHAFSPAAAAPPSLRRVNASILAKGIARAQLVWRRADGSNTKQDLRAADKTPDGWQRYRISSAAKPAGAKTVQFAITVDGKGAEPAHIADPQASAEHMGVPYVEVFCNLVGYEVRAPKFFTAAATFPTGAATFRLLNEQGSAVYESGMGAPTKIMGIDGADWGKYYWRGDFTTFDEPGKYRVEIDIEGNKARTALFEIGPDLYWDRLFTPLVNGLASLRAEEGSGRAWKSPDPADDIAVLRTLSEIYGMIQWRLPKAEPDAAHPLLKEIEWGADHLLDRTEPGPAIAVALAGSARLLPEKKAYADAARALLKAHANDEDAKLDCFCAALDLFVATGDKALMAESERLYPGAEPAVLEYLVRYESRVDEMVSNCFPASAMIAEKCEAFITASADNAFGIVPRDEAGKRNLLNTPAKDAPSVAAGNLDQLLGAATMAAKVYRFNARPEYYALIVSQFSWILGNNPFGLSLLNGLGLPDVQGPAGTLSDAIRAAAPGDDRPALYTGPSTATLRQTATCLEALANLKRIHFSGVSKS